MPPVIRIRGRDISQPEPEPKRKPKPKSRRPKQQARHYAVKPERPRPVNQEAPSCRCDRPSVITDDMGRRCLKCCRPVVSGVSR